MDRQSNLRMALLTGASALAVTMWTASTAQAGIETVVVTAEKKKENIQTVPIAISAFTQKELTERQIAGGPDLVKEVPNLTFTKTNFTGYNLEIRGIGTQAISVTTDPAVAVAFNDTPFLRNHFFEQEFYDLENVQVLRGPQGTLFGRNATAGVVNLVSAKPVDHFEAMGSVDFGNYGNQRLEGMINLPIVGDKLMLRAAAEWTKRDGYAFNEATNKNIDGRDLWSGRLSLRWKPTEDFRADFIWEHFSESDNRIRSGKQLCHTDPGPESLHYDNGHGQVTDIALTFPGGDAFGLGRGNFSQGCLPGSLYDKGNGTTDFGAFGTVNGFSLPFIQGLGFYGIGGGNPYANTHQSYDLRHIVSTGPTVYRANNDTLEFNTEWQITPSLTFNSETGYNRDFLYSTEDFNRFETKPGIFHCGGFCGGTDGSYGLYAPGTGPDPSFTNLYFCDPQLGCSDRFLLQDVSREHSWQVSQEFRLTSNFDGPFNFSAGANYLHYETVEDFIVLSNTLTAIATRATAYGGTGNPYCADNNPLVTNDPCLPYGRQNFIIGRGGYLPGQRMTYVDPNPLFQLNGQGHNYFDSKNPYILNSYAAFGEAYYNITKDLKLTGGLRYTYDDKNFMLIPTQVLQLYYGYPHDKDVSKAWHELTGRAVLSWQPQLDFTDQTLIYASYAHGYKAGGQNPPGPLLVQYGNANNVQPVHPKDFKAEFIDAYELGTKNTLLDGDLIFNADAYYYDYKDYQISQIVDRTSVNLNFNATLWGAEVQTTWTPLPGLKFAFNGGYEGSHVGDGQYAIDTMDRNYGHHDSWVVMKPWIGQSSNCVFPDYVAAALVARYGGNYSQGNQGPQSCGSAYFPAQGGPGEYAPEDGISMDPVVHGFYEPSWGGGNIPARNLVTGQPYYISADTGVAYGYPVTVGGLVYYGYDPFHPDAANSGYGPAPNGGQGFAKPVGGNEMPNAPHYTASLTAEYSMPVSPNWVATFHSDFYWQSQSWARIFNDRNYDKIHGYSNVNLAVILNDATGWQIMAYVKNLLDTTAITGDFLYSDDTGLTTNVFLTDPRLYGVRITKRFGEGDWENGGGLDFIPDFFADRDGKKPSIWITVGGNYSLVAAAQDPYVPEQQDWPDVNNGNPVYWPNKDKFITPEGDQKWPSGGVDWEGAITFQPDPDDSDWKFKLGVRYGRSSRNNTNHLSQPRKAPTTFYGAPCTLITRFYPSFASLCSKANWGSFSDAIGSVSEKHMMLDFTVGKDMGIGLFGLEGKGTLAAGVRFAEFKSRNGLNFNMLPYYTLPGKYGSDRDVYEAQTDEVHSFRGLGPEVTWDGSNIVWGGDATGTVNVDWGGNLGMLFGRQKVEIKRSMIFHCHWRGNGNSAPGSCPDNFGTFTQKPDYTIERSQQVTVPNIGAHIGLSYNYRNAKLSFGYKADVFFDAVDGGQEVRHNFNRMFYGPYLNVSIGLGG